MANLTKIILTILLLCLVFISVTACTENDGTSELTPSPPPETTPAPTPTTTPTLEPTPEPTPEPEIESEPDTSNEPKISSEQTPDGEFEPQTTEYADFSSLIASETLLINTTHETNLGIVQLGEFESLNIIRLDLSGSISYKIADFDNDGDEELLLVKIDTESTEGDYKSKILVYMHEIIDGAVTVVDRYVLLEDILFLDMGEWSDVFLMEIDGDINIVAEREGWSALFADGFMWEIRMLGYSNNRFHEVVHKEFSGSDWEDRTLAEIQDKLSDFGIEIDYRTWDWRYDVWDGVEHFDDGLLFTRLTRNSPNVRIICTISMSHDITWDDIEDFYSTGEVPVTPPIRISFS